MIDMVVFDIAGTTIQDNKEVENCFIKAAEITGLEVKREKIISMMGWSKIQVFETLWKEKPSLFDTEKGLNTKINHSFQTFKNLLEEEYKKTDILPTKGSIELFNFLKMHKVKVVLNTGFYRRVTNLLLEKVGWVKNGKSEVIDLSISSDEVTAGRPTPYMIFKAMELLNLQNVRKVIKIGDTPSDLAEGKNAGCLFSFGVLGGSHTHEQLMEYENDGILKSLVHFKDFLEEKALFD